MGVTNDGTIFNVPFFNVLQSFGLIKEKALVIINNGATSPNVVFARLLTQMALSELFT
jgi:hypothetical protein